MSSDTTPNPLDTPHIREACAVAGRRLVEMVQEWLSDGVPELLVQATLMQVAANRAAARGTATFAWEHSCRIAWTNALQTVGRKGE